MDWAFVAEDADAYQDLSRSVERYARPEVVLIHGPTGDAWSNLALIDHSGATPSGQVG